MPPRVTSLWINTTVPTPTTELAFTYSITFLTASPTSSLLTAPTPPEIHIPSLQTSDIETRNTIVFGILSTILSVLGLVLTGLMLHRTIMQQQTHEGGARDIEMQIRRTDRQLETMSESTLIDDVVVDEGIEDGNFPRPEGAR